MEQKSFCSQYGAEYLTSRKGNTVMMFAGLKDAKDREKNRLFLAEGVKLAEEALASHGKTAAVYALLVCETSLENPRIMECVRTAYDAAIKLYLVTTEVLSKISTEKAPQGIITICRKEEYDMSAYRSDGRYLMLDTIQDPGNLGTILRTAAAFGISGVILADCADPTSPKTVRASMGAVFRCPIRTTKSLYDEIRVLQKEGHRVLAAALTEDSMYVGKTELMQGDCIVIGNEGHGIDMTVIGACDGVIRIPMQEETESLNASVAASLLLWEYYRTFGLK